MRHALLRNLRAGFGLAGRGPMLGLADPAALRARDTIMHARVTLAAAVFAVLTLAWIVVDAATFTRDMALALAAGRALAAGGFAVLAWRCTRLPARAGVALLFALPFAFYAYALAVLWGRPVDHGAFALVTAYLYLPFIVVAGVAVFPLTLLEGATLVAPWLAAAALAAVGDGPLDGAQSLGLTWLLVLVAGVALIAASSQLHFVVELVTQSSRDALTGALTRRVGLELLAVQVAQAQRRDLPLGLAFLDLDRFKAVNDLYGHAAGDGVLAAAAQAMARVLRRQDSVIRWGGEEFVLVLPNTEIEGVRRTVERLAEHGLGPRPDGTPQTASLGIVERRRDGVDDAADLVALADTRMYRAKQAGRNCVFDGGEAAWPFATARAADITRASA
jgi:diguanylate cyclase (GGDEF)-like protein